MQLVSDITLVEANKFIQMVHAYPTHFPIDVLANYEQFVDQIYARSTQISEQSITLESPADQCLFCPTSKQNWFEFKTPEMLKNATLYASNKIGK